MIGKKLGNKTINRSTCHVQLISVFDLSNFAIRVLLSSLCSYPQVCDKIGVEYGTYYFDAGQVKRGAGMSISSLDTKEMATAVLHQLPEVTELDQEAYDVSA